MPRRSGTHPAYGPFQANRSYVPSRPGDDAVVVNAHAEDAGIDVSEYEDLPHRFPSRQTDRLVGLEARPREDRTGSAPTMDKQAANAFDKEFDNRIRPKLEACEVIREDLKKEGISVPGIVVCGAQSAGKSSVLEYLSDLNFPRAENTCTRCPTIVSLTSDASLTESYALIGLEAKQDAQERVDDLSTFGAKVEELTKTLTEKIGLGSGVITTDPIYVTVVRPSGPTFTIIDIPGITHMCTEGVQADIHDVTSGMVKSYMKDPNMVLLVVIPATDDFGNAEALKIATEYDPHGTRTLGVVTKSDLVKEDSDIVDKIKMRGKNIHLQLGFVALRCRTPSEVKNGMSKKEAMRAESVLFSTHPLLSSLDQTEWGIASLVAKIISVQAERVEDFIPEIKNKLDKYLRDARKTLASLSPPCADSAAKHARLDDVVRRIDRNIREITQGTHGHDAGGLTMPSKWYNYSNAFGEDVRTHMPNYFGEECATDIAEKLKRVQGVSLPNFLSASTFRTIVSDVFFGAALSENEIDGILLQSSIELMCRVESDMRSAIESRVDAHASDFPRLATFIKDAVVAMLDNQRGILTDHLQAILRSERCKPYTFNHYFMDTYNKALADIKGRANEDADTSIDRLRIGDRVQATYDFGDIKE